MDLQPGSTLRARTLVAYSRAEAFAENTISILGRLGYQILTPEEFEKPADEDGPRPAHPDLFLVDERRLSELPGELPAPVVLLTGREGASGDDPRVAAAVKRPAGLHDLFRVVQEIFEETPRSTPRVATDLEAVCRHAGEEWDSSVSSLSENGCRLRGAVPLPLGARVQLAVALPGAGTVHLHAEAAYQLLRDGRCEVGLVFSAISPQMRRAIADFVTASLLEGTSPTR